MRFISSLCFKGFAAIQMSGDMSAPCWFVCFDWGLTSYSRVFHLYDNGLSTSHYSWSNYGGKTRENLVKTTHAISGATTCDLLIFLMIGRRTRSRELYIDLFVRFIEIYRRTQRYFTDMTTDCPLYTGPCLIMVENWEETW